MSHLSGVLRTKPMTDDTEFTKWCSECGLMQKKQGDGRCPSCFHDVNTADTE